MEELFKTIMETVVKQVEQQKSVQSGLNNHVNYINHDESQMKREATQMAKIIKTQYDKFIEVGFSEVQAIQLMKAILN